MVPVAAPAADEVTADGLEVSAVPLEELQAASVAPAPTARAPDRNVRRDSADENRSDTTSPLIEDRDLILPSKVSFCHPLTTLIIYSLSPNFL
jgi:hypothetical protein